MIVHSEWDRTQEFVDVETPPVYDTFAPDDTVCDYCGKDVATEAVEYGLGVFLLCSECVLTRKDEINYNLGEI